MISFQSTLPRGERRSAIWMRRSSSSFQSTLPRGERPSCFMSVTLVSTVSIHAPTRGATGRASSPSP